MAPSSTQSSPESCTKADGSPSASRFESEFARGLRKELSRRLAKPGSSLTGEQDQREQDPDADYPGDHNVGHDEYEVADDGDAADDDDDYYDDEGSHDTAIAASVSSQSAALDVERLQQQLHELVESSAEVGS